MSLLPRRETQKGVTQAALNLLAREEAWKPGRPGRAPMAPPPTQVVVSGVIKCGNARVRWAYASACVVLCAGARE